MRIQWGATELHAVLLCSFPFVRIDGTMSLKKRAEVVQQFHYDPEVCAPLKG